MNMKKSALVTGGSRGIGLGVAVELGKAGFSLAINGVRDEEQVNETLLELRSLGTEVVYVKGDISQASGRQAMFDKVLATFGHLNVLVNNAGIAPLQRKDILEAEEESFDHVMDVNLKGPYFLTQMFAMHMVETR